MPEGDSIKRIERWLRPALVGATLERVVVRGLARGPIGRGVTAVTAIGKHLVIATDDGTEIRVHLGMNGRWSRIDPTAPVAGGDRVSLVLATARDMFVLRRAATVELTERRAAGRGMALASIGPDILDPELDLAAVLDNVADQPATRAIGDLLLDQRVVAGIGNIYRCEALFLCRVDPRTPVGTLDPDAVEAIVATARALMQASVAGQRADHCVYRRVGEPCRRCGSRIDAFVFGDPPRRAYLCPVCQPPTGPTTPERGSASPRLP